MSDSPPAVRHGALREGVALGLVVATGIWIWLVLVDAAAGEPFRTFTVLGGVIAFTVTHYLLNLAYGLAIVAGVRGTAREPALAMSVVLVFLIIEIAFAFLTTLLSNLGLGRLAWARIFGGSLVGAVIAIVFLSRRHPLLAQLRQAEEQR